MTPRDKTLMKASFCKELKRLDNTYKTPENSPLHHDNRCPLHSRKVWR